MVTALMLVGLSTLLVASPAIALELPGMVPARLGALPRAGQHAPSHRGFESRFELDGGHGYRLAVTGRGDTVLVEVGRPGSLRQPSLQGNRFLSQSLTAYAARGTVTPHRIAASFGKFGKIDVRFRPRGKAVALPTRRRCRAGDRVIRQRGAFVGDVRFEGERNYVAVHAHRAAGRVRSPLRPRCLATRSRPSASPRQRPVEQPRGGFHGSLAAVWRHAVKSTELFVFGNARRTISVAVAEESLGRMAEFHLALSISRPRVFAIDDALTLATLAPPAPFHGKGTYRAAPDGSRSWTGPLSASFPGAPRWPLTGAEFKVKLNAGL